MPERYIPDLRDALEAGQIVPYFQPQIYLSTGELYGFEVLARWQHPQLGLILPNEFIPWFEAAGLMGELSESVVESAAASARLWPESLRLSFNVSPVQLHQRSLPARLQAAAERGGIGMQRIIVEVTESALIGNIELARSVAGELKRAGAGLALDDFGTGYSSLRHLQALPFDEVKVDASFVRGMVQQRSCRKIVAAVVGLGNSLGLTTIAEGVEDQAQANMLLSMGCDFAQGWLHGRPVPAEEAAAHIQTRRTRPEPDRMPSHIAQHLDASPAERLAQLRAIYDASPVGLAFLDRRMRYISLNRRLAEMHRLPLEAHLGRALPDILPSLARKVEHYIRRALAGEEFKNLEIHLEDPIPARTYLVCYHPARDEAGEVVGVVVAVQEIDKGKLC